ncbi:MAG: alkaline phosphatase family protein [Deltaproteobacteria bacterium]|nr:alkaline phosphatase family protein [Deltaproteobacteria bacterium]
MRLRSPSLPSRSRVAAAAALVAVAGLVAVVVSSTPAHAGKRPGGRVVILGFDGVDPELYQKWAKDGDFANLKRLAQSGAFAPLESTLPPQSPVAWASFATGTNPGKHGIFDFIKRDPSSYLPGVGTNDYVDPTFTPDGKLATPPRATNPRQGPPFWKVASDAGLAVAVLSVPYTFPPDPLNEQSRMLSGLGVPDLRMTNSSYAYYGSDVKPADSAKPISGGVPFRLEFKNDVAESTLEGPVDARATTKPRPRLKVPVKVEKLGGGKVRLTIGGQAQEAAAGAWTGWYDVSFAFGDALVEHGVTRARVLSVAPEVRIYLAPVSMDPRNPPIPVTSPNGYGAELAKKGVFKTVGWVEDTSALNADNYGVDEETFLQDVYSIVEEREQKTIDALAQPFDLVISAFTATDRISHLFYRLLDTGHPEYDAALAKRYGNAIREAYRRMDAFVGKVQAVLKPEDTLIVISDHGFHSFRRGVNLNTWLVQNCFLTLKGKGCGDAVKPADMPNGDFLLDAEWTKTKAYAFGTGQIYVNLAGREKNGIVAKGEEYDKLVTEISAKLGALVDPKTNTKAVAGVFRGDKSFTGDAAAKAPDLQVAFVEGYRTDWKSILGGMTQEVVVTNEKKWSGDHSSSDPKDTQGVVFASVPIQSKSPGIVDIGPTALKRLGVAVPANMDGKPIL